MSMLTRIAAAFAAVAVLTPAAARAQQSVDLVAHVPFAFSIGNAELPSETYQLSSLNGHPEMLLVRGDRHGVVVRGEDVREQSRATHPVLVFHRYGDAYFLREVRLEGSARLDLPETKAERAAAERRVDRAAAAMQSVIVSADER
jgi:hypothetical protein